VDTVAEQLLIHLRRIAPHKVRVYDSSDEYRDVAVPTRRRKWAQVIATIEARPWVRCELLDKSGAALGYVENNGPPGELEDLSGSQTPRAAEQRWLLELMIKAQTVALTFRDKEHASILQGMRDMMQVQTDAMRETIGLMREQRDIVAETAALKAAAEKGDDLDQIVKLIEASPKLMQVVGPLVMALRAPKKIAATATKPPASGANGAK
jgi:hypothetical protein